MSRLGLIALGFVTLSAPAAGLCAGMAGSMDPCAMTASHDMAGCADEVANASSCCDPGAVGGSTDVILNRPDEGAASLADAGWVAAPGAFELAALRANLPNAAPPPRPATYRLFSALLL